MIGVAAALVHFVMMIIKIDILLNINGVIDFSDNPKIEDEDKFVLGSVVVGFSLFFDIVFQIYILKMTYDEVKKESFKISDKFKKHMTYLLPISMILELAGLILLGAPYPLLYPSTLGFIIALIYILFIILKFVVLPYDMYTMFKFDKELTAKLDDFMNDIDSKNIK